jgi:hypothetical protein
MLVQPVPAAPTIQQVARGGGGKSGATQNTALQLIVSAVQVAQSAAIIAVTGKGSSVNTSA